MSRDKATLTSLGMFIRPFDERKRSTVFGAHVVSGDLPVQLARHGSLESYHYFAAPEHLSRAQDAFRGQRRVEVRSHLQLVTDPPRISVWHDPFTGGFTRAFHLRRTLGQQPFPITLAHHTVSYQSMLHDAFLALLLEDVRPIDALVCTSSKAREACRRLFDVTADSFNARHGTALSWKGRIETIPFGVDTQLFKPRERGDLRRMFRLPDHATVLLWFGRISPMEKADLVPLLTVFERLVLKNPGQELMLVIAGTDVANDSAALTALVDRRRLGDRVAFRPGDPQTRHLLHAAADVFVSPVDSVQETFGLTPIEALACGVPQVVSDWDGYTDTVEHGVTGFRVRTSWARCDDDARSASYLGEGAWDHYILGQSVSVDLSQLEQSLQLLIENEGLRHRMGEASRARALRLFDWSVVTQAHEALWAELSARAGLERTSSPEGYQVPNFFDSFAHYATTRLTGSELIRLSSSGRALVSGREAIPDEMPPGTFGIVRDKALVDSALALLSDTDGASLDTVTGAVVAERGCPRQRALRHILWLLKYGYVELAAPSA